MSANELTDIAIGILNTKPLQQHGITGEIQNCLMLKMQKLAFKRMLHLDFVIRKTKSEYFFKTIQLKVKETFLEKVEHFLRDDQNNVEALPAIAYYIDNHSDTIRPDILE